MAASTTALSRDRIVDEAIALLADEGPTALSMRKLAQRLGVSTMSTYHHVADKETLVELIAERIMAELAQPAPGDDWPDAVRTLAWSFRDLTLRHPSAFKVLLAGPRPAALLRTAEQTRALLVSRGFSDDEALLVFRTFVRYLMGSTVAELSAIEGDGDAHTRQAESERQFRYGIDALIAGVSTTRAD